jgi:uncharacterized protein
LEAGRDNLKFSLESWPEAGLKVDFVLPPSLLSLYLEAAVDQEGAEADSEPPVLASSMWGHLDIQLFGRRLRLKGSFAVKVELICHRCLAAFVDKIGDNIDETVDLLGRDEEVRGDQLAIEIVDNQFDLTPILCEYFWLSWPIKILCRPDCAGLCLTCGANLNDGPCSCQETLIIRH